MRAREKIDEWFMPKFRANLFGIVNEGACTQHNYFFHEPGKCYSNAVVSMLHDYLQNQIPELGKCSILRINADSCGG